jgi:beta-glucosidase/6-phospho-beta-glucosidase/beta-galactosidase
MSSLSTTTWGSWNSNATAAATDTNNPFGNAAWTALWKRANPPNFTETAIYSTTVSPTPVPTSELILPPADYFGPTDCYYFPEDFIFGMAGSAAQIEGAVAEEGRAPTIMELLIQDDRPKDYVTNENYYLYKQDIERLAAQGVEYYSFSIAWTRILPFALPGTPINQQGIDHYNDLINFVLEKGMKPVVTIFHFDTPLQFFSNLSTIADDVLIGYVNGGYQNSTFEDAFVNYGKIILTHFADRVPIFVTFNEPLLYCSNGISVDHVIKAHARLYHFYHDSDKINGTGLMSMKFNDNFGVPLDPSNSSHVIAANHFNDFQLATFGNPIFLGIDYPEAYKMTIPDYVPLTAADLAYLNNTADFFGVDPYTATVVAPPDYGIAACTANISDPLFPYCVNQSTTNIWGWSIGYRSQSYVYTTPTFLRSYLSYLWNTYKKPIILSEFGFPVWDEADKALPDQLFDSPRSTYYLSYMSEVLKSIWEDHVHVLGALIWSFADNWEFGDYDAHFGVQTVNRTTQVRNYKKSFFDIVDFYQSRKAPTSK